MKKATKKVDTKTHNAKATIRFLEDIRKVFEADVVEITVGEHVKTIEIRYFDEVE